MAQHVLVVGAGTMGAGIAQVCAQSGRTVTLVERERAALSRARAGMASSLQRLAGKGRLAETPQAVLERVDGVVGELDAISAEIGADVGIEAVF